MSDIGSPSAPAPTCIAIVTNSWAASRLYVQQRGAAFFLQPQR
jgi:hypothetical protein